MTWNYRVVRRNHPKWGDTYTFIEAYYDDDGEITAWCEASAPAGDDADGLAGDLSLMAAAVQATEHGTVGVLVPADLPGATYRAADEALEAK